MKKTKLRCRTKDLKLETWLFYCYYRTDYDACMAYSNSDCVSMS